MVSRLLCTHFVDFTGFDHKPLAIQLGKLSGFSPIITTASLSNTSYLQSLGATHVFDRGLSAGDLKAQITAITSAPIHHVFVTVAPTAVQELGLHILDKGGRVAVIKPQPDIKSGDGKEVSGVAAWLRTPNNIPLLEPFFHDLAAELLEKGIIKVSSSSDTAVTLNTDFIGSQMSSRYFQTAYMESPMGSLDWGKERCLH